MISDNKIEEKNKIAHLKKQMRLLSICIPTYNRLEELKKLFESIPDNEELEIIICDDGSTDATKLLIEQNQKFKKIIYEFQPNSGRALALNKALKLATGEYTIIMDSDDYFTKNGIEEILSTLKNNLNFNAFVFGTILKKGNEEIFNIPPKTTTNFIKIRADLGVKGDLKEVVKSTILRDCLPDVLPGCRRIPTYLIWSAVAEKCDCLSIPTSVAVKEYLPGGMTDKILYLKTLYSHPMSELYIRLSESKYYDSKKYRWRSRLLWARYSLHANNYNFNMWWKTFIYPAGLTLFLIDTLKLWLKNLIKN